MRHMWISSNGLRRRGTTLRDLNKLFSTSMTVREICEPLQSVSSNSKVKDVCSDLKKKAFDIAGVSDEENGPVIGYVFTKELTSGKCIDHKKNFSKDVLISENTSIINLIKILSASNPFKFVLNGSNVDEIITISDLQKPPVRIVLFGLVNLLEMNLTAIGQKVFPNDEWIEKIPKNRSSKAKDIHTQRSQNECDTSLFECLELCDKLEIVLNTSGFFNNNFKPSRNKQHQIKEDLRDLRDRLSHANEISPNKIQQILESIEILIDRCENFIESINTSL
jgi:hypothetical protein